MNNSFHSECYYISFVGEYQEKEATTTSGSFTQLQSLTVELEVASHAVVDRFCFRLVGPLEERSIGVHHLLRKTKEFR